jgi:hypothetical protein
VLTPVIFTEVNQKGLQWLSMGANEELNNAQVETAVMGVK